MPSLALFLLLAVPVGGSHAFLLWRLVGGSALGGSRARLVRGALVLRLIPATALLAAIWAGSAEAAVSTLAGLCLGRSLVVTGLRARRR